MAALRAIEVLGTLLSGLNIDESMMGFVVTPVYFFVELNMDLSC